MKALPALATLILSILSVSTSVFANRHECVASPSAPAVYYTLELSDSGALIAVTRNKVNAGYRLSWNARAEDRPVVTDTKTGREARDVFEKTELFRQVKEGSYKGTHDSRVDGKNLILVDKKNRALELDISFGLEAEDKRYLSSPVIFAGAEVSAAIVYACGNDGSLPVK